MPERFEQPELTRAQFGKEVKALLKREGISILPEEQESFNEELKGSDRYIRALIEHQEGTGRVKRFIKIPVGTPEMQKVFKREIGINNFLRSETSLRVERIIKANTEQAKGRPFAIMEALERHEDEIGFDGHGEHLTPEAADGFTDALQKLHAVDTSRLPKNLRGAMEKFPGSYEELEEEMMAILRQISNPLDAKVTEETFNMVITRRMKVSDFREKVAELLKRLKPVIDEQEGKKEILVHGNLDPGNAFVHQDGTVELIDFEFTGLSKNEILGTMIDFGNLRARAWNSKEFRDAFDEAIIDFYKAKGQEAVGRAIVSLGILRSHLVLAGFFESYDHEKQRDLWQAKRRKATEQDIAKAWEVAGLKL